MSALRLGMGIAIGLLAACGGATKPAGTTPPPVDPSSLQGALEREIGAGGPVAVLASADGLTALSADGSRRKVIVPGPVGWCLVDPRAQVIWFGAPEHTTVQILDLAAPPGTAPETVITGLPAEVDPTPATFAVVYGDGAAAEELGFGHWIRPRIEIHVGASPKLVGSGEILAQWERLPEWQEELDRAQLPGRDRLVALARRGAGRSALLPRPAAQELPRVTSVDVSECPDDETVCGTAEAVAGTKLWRVAVSFSCGDGCYTQYKLYDPTRTEFLEGEWTTWLQDSWVAPDGSAFAGNGRIVSFTKGVVVLLDEEVEGGGWLGGGWYYGP